MKELIPFVLFLLLIGGANLIRWWIEKRQRQQPHEEPPQGPDRPPWEAARPPRRLIFYGRSDSMRPLSPPRPETYVPPDQPRRRPIHPQPVPIQPPAAPTTGIRRQPTRRTVRCAAKPRSFQPASKEPRREIRPVMGRPLHGLESRDERQPPTPQVPEAPRQKISFLGNLLDRGNLAKAVVLSEIFGPPRSLREL